jgi:predicted TIM-barrel fold metal-dependent hydrolase
MVLEAEAVAGKRTAFSVIDCDVHPIIAGPIGVIFPYLATSWQRRLDPYRNSEIYGPLPGRGAHWAPGVGRADATPPDGGPAGSDPAFLKAQHLDAHNIEAAVLLNIQASRVSGFTNPDDAAAVAHGYNEALADKWLSSDRRLRLAMNVAPQDPQLAAAEIRAFGRRPGVVGVWMPVLNISLGDRHYYPIYEAAVEMALPIVLHSNGTQGTIYGGPTFALGNPTSEAEKHSQLMEFGISGVSSLVFEGVFERYKELRFVFTEYGWTWLAALLWRMDETWKPSRKLVPWVRRPPSEYVFDHIRLTSQPALDPPTQKHLEFMLDIINADRTLLYSSDYPHWDADEPEFPFRNLPLDRQQRLMHDNAAAVYTRIGEEPF